MSDLANILVKLRLVTPEQIEEAMDAQVLNGGRLGTNLVELGHLTEPKLAEALQTLHRLPALHGTIEPHANALAVIKPEWCDKHNLVPLRLEGQKLYIGLLSPYTAEQARLLGERLGYEIAQVIIPEFRMNQLLRKYAKAFRPVRPIDLKTGAKPAEEKPAAQQKPDELMSEDEFQQLYAQALTGGRHGDLDQAHAEHADKDHAPHAEDHASPLHGIQAPKSSKPSLPPSPMLATTAPSPAAEPKAPPPLVPLSFAEAQAALAQTQDREGIAHVVMRFAAGKFKRVLLMTLHGDVATGWEGVGEGLAGNRARRVAIPIAADGTLKLVRESRSHFLGPIKRDAGVEAFFKLIGGAPQTSLVMPVLAKGRVVNLVYADSGPNQPTSADVGELLIVAQKVGRAYEEFLARRKAAAAATQG